MEFLKLALESEKLGLVGFLALSLALCIWVIRFLYKEKGECEDDRRAITQHIGELKGDVKALEKSVEAQEQARADHAEQMQSLHRNVLEAVVRSARGPS